MLQEDQIRKLTNLKELLDTGVLTEVEFSQAKTRVLEEANVEQTSSGIPKQRKDLTREEKHMLKPDSVTGPANVGLSSGLVLSLGILAIVFSLAGSILLALSVSGYFYQPIGYNNDSFVCVLLCVIAELVLWICAFKKLSAAPNGNRLGTTPIWMYLYLGCSVLASYITSSLFLGGGLSIIVSFIAIALGYVAHILLYKAYTGKMRTYSMVWMVGVGVAFAANILSSRAVVGADVVLDIIDACIYVFLMIALLEKESCNNEY